MAHSEFDVNNADFQWKAAQSAANRGDYFEAARRLGFLEDITAIYRDRTEEDGDGVGEEGDDFVCTGHHPLEEYGIAALAVAQLKKQVYIDIASFELSQVREFNEQYDTAGFRHLITETGEPLEFFGTNEVELAGLDVAYQRFQIEEQAMLARLIPSR